MKKCNKGKVVTPSFIEVELYRVPKLPLQKEEEKFVGVASLLRPFCAINHRFCRIHSWQTAICIIAVHTFESAVMGSAPITTLHQPIPQCIDTSDANKYTLVKLISPCLSWIPSSMHVTKLSWYPFATVYVHALHCKAGKCHWSPVSQCCSSWRNASEHHRCYITTANYIVMVGSASRHRCVFPTVLLLKNAYLYSIDPMLAQWRTETPQVCE